MRRLGKERAKVLFAGLVRLGPLAPYAALVLVGGGRPRSRASAASAARAEIPAGDGSGSTAKLPRVRAR